MTAEPLIDEIDNSLRKLPTEHVRFVLRLVRLMDEQTPPTVSITQLLDSVQPVDAQFAKQLDEFIDTYRPALEALAH